VGHLAGVEGDEWRQRTCDAAVRDRQQADGRDGACRRSQDHEAWASGPQLGIRVEDRLRRTSGKRYSPEQAVTRFIVDVLSADSDQPGRLVLGERLAILG